MFVGSSSSVRLIIEKGIYEINAQITFPSDIYIDFGGAEFKRQSGDIFDMFTNNDHVNGDTNLTIKNLTINGNKIQDALTAVNPAHRFSGFKFVKVKHSKLQNISVTQTVNREIQTSTNTSAGGIYFTDSCNNINCYELNAYDNDRTGILIDRSQEIRIFGSLTHDNGGSGISSFIAPRYEYYDIISHDNGFFPDYVWGDPNNTNYHYSNVSVNGVNSKVSGVLTYHCTGTGLNIGHSDPEGNKSDFTIVSNIESYGNELEGITITNSDQVIMSNLNRLPF